MTPPVDAPRVAIVILNWNSCDDVLHCVSTLPRLTYPNYSVTIVDNASVDGSVEALFAGFNPNSSEETPNTVRAYIRLKRDHVSSAKCSSPVRAVRPAIV